jgi:hypothetical protein
MLMHSCCCILFIGMTGFDPNAKRIQKSFENEFGKPIWKKEKESFPSPSLSSFSACWPNYSRPTHLPCLLPFLLPLPGPAQTAEATAAASPLFLSPVDSLGPPISAFSFLTSREVKGETVALHPHSESWERPHTPDSIKGSSDLSPLPLLPRRSSSPLS